MRGEQPSAQSSCCSPSSSLLLPSPACGRGAGGGAPRRGRACRADRRVAFTPGLRFTDDAESPLAASVYSLPSFFFDAATAEPSSPRSAAAPGPHPDRADRPAAPPPPRSRAPRRSVSGSSTPTAAPTPPGRAIPSAWSARPAGSVLVLVRPNLQPGREEDAHLGPELVQDLPDEIDRAWGGVTWAEAPVPFHNGQVLLTRDAAWITLHALEPRILALLGLARVPVETLRRRAGDRPLRRRRRKAARELSEPLRPARPLRPPPARAGRPRRGGLGPDPPDRRRRRLRPRLDRHPAARRKRHRGPGGGRLGRPRAPREVCRRRTGARSGAGYGLEPEGEPLAAALAAAQRTPRADALDGFLDLTAEHLAAEGFEVRRLPLLRRPRRSAPRPGGPHPSGVPVTWNNVVVETRDGGLRAEGFASLLPAATARPARPSPPPAPASTSSRRWCAA